MRRGCPAPSGSVLERAMMITRPSALDWRSWCCNPTSSERRSAPANLPAAAPESGTKVTGKPICDDKLAKIIKRLAHKADLAADLLSGHSLRSGLATSVGEGGGSERSIMDQTRHRSLKNVRKYIRRGCLFRDNDAARSGF